MNRSVKVVENEDGTATVYVKPSFNQYDFACFEDAVSAVADCE